METYPSAAELLARAPDPLGCVVSDFIMPEMSGLELQETLTACAVDLPFIIMTGQGDVFQAVRAMKAGAVDFLEKPLVQGELIDAVRRALANSRYGLAVRAVALAVRTAGLAAADKAMISMIGKP